MSRKRVFDLEFRWLTDVEAQAKQARIPWIEKLAQELKAKIPPFVEQLESEDSQESSDTSE